MKVLDIASGLGGWSQAFLDRHHYVLRVDNDSQFSTIPRTVIADMTYATSSYKSGDFDVVLASPPCRGFSVQSIGKMWKEPGIPKHPTAEEGIQLLYSVLGIIEELNPRYWWLENPMGMMRKMPILERVPRVTITYCQYGERRQKPTDLWGKWPSTWTPRPMCERGAPCHDAAPRGSRTGTQGITGPAKALIPYELSLEVCLAVEEAMEIAE